MSLAKLEKILDATEGVLLQERLKIVRDTGMYSVLRLAISANETPKLSGSGTPKAVIA